MAGKGLIENDFIGKSVVKGEKENGWEGRRVGVEVLGKGIGRRGYEVVDENSNEIGLVR
ncbi:hypothetical protein [Staphylococcus epidermidis]|uniref:hypothetical protein n=1 Tax=Staphylococcus epidermidis TaxID=1282 RepID=UPI0016432A35